MKDNNTIILGAGITELAASLSSQHPVFEARQLPGGICSSYYIRPGESEAQVVCPEDQEAYRVEYGGGQWIFGGNPAVLHFMQSLTPLKSYVRSSAVYFSQQKLFVPYPLQNHLSSGSVWALGVPGNCRFD